ARWEGFEFRPGDIVISTPKKCGTTWTQMLCALLIFDGPVFRSRWSSSPPDSTCATGRRHDANIADEIAPAANWRIRAPSSGPADQASGGLAAQPRAPTGTPRGGVRRRHPRPRPGDHAAPPP